MATVRISDDALAIACGADAVAAAFEKAGHSVKRVSSWGMQWLEPLVEIDGKGFGPASPADVAEIIDGSSSLAIGTIAEHPWIANQQRLTFAKEAAMGINWLHCMKPCIVHRDIKPANLLVRFSPSVHVS